MDKDMPDLLSDHRPIPGPDYWSYRCTVCGEPVRDHTMVTRREANIGAACIVIGSLVAVYVIIHWLG